MINFEEELRKYHPAVEIRKSGDAIQNQEYRDLTDVLLNMTGITQQAYIERMQAAQNAQAAQGTVNQDTGI